MKSVPAWVIYSVLRVVLFVVPLAVLLTVGIEWWLSTLLAALIGLCLSYIFLRKPREAVATNLYAARHRPAEEVVSDDAASEDAALDRAEAADQATDAESSVTAPADTHAETHSEREGKSE